MLKGFGDNLLNAQFAAGQPEGFRDKVQAKSLPSPPGVYRETDRRGVSFAVIPDLPDRGLAAQQYPVTSCGGGKSLLEPFDMRLPWDWLLAKRLGASRGIIRPHPEERGVVHTDRAKSCHSLWVIRLEGRILLPLRSNGCAN